MKAESVLWPVVITAVLFVNPGMSAGADSAVRAIRDMYSAYNHRIEQQQVEGGREGPQRMTVAGVTTERAVGPVERTITVYYDHNDVVLESGEFRYEPIVRKVITVQETAWRTVREYFFDPSGQLVFYFQKHDGPHDYPEKRLYFSERKLVRIVVTPSAARGDEETEDKEPGLFGPRPGARNRDEWDDGDRREADAVQNRSERFRMLPEVFTGV